MEKPRPRLLFITGKLAEHSLRQTLIPLSQKANFEFEICVLGITVAALMTTPWILRKLKESHSEARAFDQAIIPGSVEGELNPLQEHLGFPVIRGPKDLFDLPEFFGHDQKTPPDLAQHTIEILAEINHAPRLSLDQILRQAESYRESGADVIDLGCLPGVAWPDLETTIQTLHRHGFRLSIDSFSQDEVQRAVASGVKLVLSANSSNRDWAQSTNAEFVLVPDHPQNLETLVTTREAFLSSGTPFRLDPILEPIGFGFGESVSRYRQIRQQFPADKMMMGVGNLTEMTEVDSSGVNFLLAALCTEWRIESILTTEVINWSRSSIREFEIARRLTHFAIEQQRVPKHLGGSLVLLRDPKLKEQGEAGLTHLRQLVTDPNFRIFAERGEIHLFNRDGYWHGNDPYEVYDRMISCVGTLTAEHAFYLGYELCKAKTALTLGKHYQQDQSLRWGFLTEPEISATERRKQERRQQQDRSQDMTLENQRQEERPA
ncbi:Pterin binding enzyme [Planctopirus ephydatiae]|uniref:Pterin binding enzyme n=1 Tax=Planctopirus ephydatiae TaxID=2528019 RepID=A0A518GQS1_9PLAN|nr:DUF6513 domain-containing protein [Planctopirus ephydatiae]QDV30919.1 Pterin binding enzyme [Planctopirus ephydatiae]